MKNNIKKLVVSMTAMLCVFGVSANDVYVEQIGNNSTVNITQQGIGNTIGDSVNAAFIGGGSNLVNIQQIGDANVLAMVVNGAGTNTTLTTNGNNNLQSINCGTTGQAGCSGSNITQLVTGDGNTVTQNLGAGANHDSYIDITGDKNVVTHNSTMSAASNVKITLVGGNAAAPNIISVTQSGTLVQNVTLSSTGNGNNIAIVQSN
jgi:hypothetical protein